MGVREGDESGQPGQAPEGGVPSVGPGRGRGKPLTGVYGLYGWMVDGGALRTLLASRPCSTMYLL